MKQINKFKRNYLNCRKINMKDQKIILKKNKKLKKSCKNKYSQKNKNMQNKNLM